MKSESLRRSISAGLVSAQLLCGIALDASAGDLDPPAPPAPTMSTLDQLYDRADRPPSWDRDLPSDDGTGAEPTCNSSRFQCIFGNDAVLDRQTGLVWQRWVPSDPRAWNVARERCLNTVIFGLGWRLPTAAELGSLATTQTPSGLPPGHPFLNTVNNMHLWTNTLYVTTNGFVIASNGSVRANRLEFNGANTGFSNALADVELRYWCVRGPNSGGL